MWTRRACHKTKSATVESSIAIRELGVIEHVEVSLHGNAATFDLRPKTCASKCLVTQGKSFHRVLLRHLIAVKDELTSLNQGSFCSLFELEYD